MSFLYHRNTKKVINAVWAVVAVIVSIGMILFFAPGIVGLL